MLTLYLNRVTSMGAPRTFGTLHDWKHVPFAVALEPPWKDNRTNISCIPAGDYLCEIVQSPKYGRVYEIKNVPDRTHVLIHRLNLVKETQACVGVGEEFGILNGEPAILDSGKAFKELMDVKLYGVLKFWLSIRWCSG